MATEDEKLHESITIDTLKKCESRPNHSKQQNATTCMVPGSICMVPDSLRSLNPDAYTPRIISIGPLHKKDQRLRAMEKHKETYMNRLFCRTVESRKEDEDMKQKIRTCKTEVFGLIGQARACYAPSLTNYDDSELATLMVIDGCFILELLYTPEHGIMAGDPVFYNMLVERDVKYDLLLLENQIPFFILEKLFNITVKSFLKKISLTDLVLSFFKDMNILKGELTLKNGEVSKNGAVSKNGTVEHCHIFGLLQSCYRARDSICGEGVPASRYSATEIVRAGVTFKPQENAESQLAMKFEQSPLVPGFRKLFIREASFVIPVLHIQDSTPSFLRNLIAYEQCYPSSRQYVTSFAILMDMLIDTNDDVSLLVRAKVLQHNLGACEDVTNLFNNICNCVVKCDFYYSDEWTKLDNYRNSFWPRILISLRRLYRSTTWKTLTVIAAVVIFTLTLIQTIYSVRNA